MNWMKDFYVLIRPNQNEVMDMVVEEKDINGFYKINVYDWLDVFK